MKWNKNYPKLFVIGLLVVLIFFGGLFKFVSNKRKDSVLTIPKGCYINFSFLNRINDTLIDKIPVFCYEICFFNDDSCKVNFGTEWASYKIESQNGRLFIKNIFQHRNLYIQEADSNFLVLEDSSATNQNSNSVFKKVANTSNTNFVFQNYLNIEFLSGRYFIKDSNDSIIRNVEFKVDGQVLGLNNYSNYEICVAGDCQSASKEPMNIISFFNSKNEMEYFGLQKSWNRITLFKLSDELKDVKGERNMIDTAFVFWKQ